MSEADLEKRIAPQQPDDTCTLIYTSGTTGNPKGVMISHDNIVWTARQVISLLDAGSDDHIISYLPSAILPNRWSVCTPRISWMYRLVCGKSG
ncbi:MAG: AMP-binding protein [Desulfobacterales bacterium]